MLMERQVCQLAQREALGARQLLAERLELRGEAAGGGWARRAAGGGGRGGRAHQIVKSMSVCHHHQNEMTVSPGRFGCKGSSEALHC